MSKIPQNHEFVRVPGKGQKSLVFMTCGLCAGSGDYVTPEFWESGERNALEGNIEKCPDCEGYGGYYRFHVHMSFTLNDKELEGAMAFMGDKRIKDHATEIKG